MKEKEPEPEPEPEPELGEDAEQPALSDYDDWDNEGYFFVRNKHSVIEYLVAQVQKIFGAYSIHVLGPRVYSSTPFLTDSDLLWRLDSICVSWTK